MRRLLPFPLKYPGVRVVFPGFPVEFGGVGELYAAFLTESRTRGRLRMPGGKKSVVSGDEILLIGVTYSRSQYCVRPSMETPTNPRTFSLVPPSSTEIRHL
jgi:hypothetical protein